MISSELYRHLDIKEENKEAIRQKLSRANAPIMKIGGFFSRNQSFIYLQSQFNTDLYVDKLMSAFRDYSAPVYSIIRHIEINHGFIEAKQLPVYSFYPIENLKGHKNVNNIIEILKKVQILEQDGDCIKLHNKIYTYTSNSYRNFKALELAKTTVLNQFNIWARSIKITSYYSGDNYKEFGKFLWSYTAVSYINVMRDKNKYGYILADIVLGEVQDLEIIKFFLEKVKFLKNQKGLYSFQPFLLLENPSIEIIDSLKNHGVIVGTLDYLFGMGYTKSLRDLIVSINEIGKIINNDNSKFLKVIDKIEKLSGGKTINLRGDLFEFVVAYYHSTKASTVEIGKILKLDYLNSKESDIVAFYSNQTIVFAECKALKARLDYYYVENWINERIPFMYKWVREQNVYNNYNVKFELWSTGGFEDNALKALEQTSSTKKYQVEYYDFNTINAKLKSLKSKKVNDLIRDYFVNSEV